MTTQPTLYIIDGYAQFFRAYHAIRTPMTSPVTKEPTNLTFGFVGMLLKILRRHPTCSMPAATLLPHRRSTSRRSRYIPITNRPRIQSNTTTTTRRPPQQVERCLSLLKKSTSPSSAQKHSRPTTPSPPSSTDSKTNTPTSASASSAKTKTSNNSSAHQPPTPPRRDVRRPQTVRSHDAAALASDTGLSPTRSDMLALMGDNVDNIKGVEGVGPKTAAQLIASTARSDNLITPSKATPTQKSSKANEAKISAPNSTNSRPTSASSNSAQTRRSSSTSTQATPTTSASKNSRRSSKNSASTATRTNSARSSQQEANAWIPGSQPDQATRPRPALIHLQPLRPRPL